MLIELLNKLKEIPTYKFDKINFIELLELIEEAKKYPGWGFHVLSTGVDYDELIVTYETKEIQLKDNTGDGTHDQLYFSLIINGTEVWGATVQI